MEKPDLLLLHGALGSKDQFNPLLPLLEDYFEIYTMDFTGHGDGHAVNEFGIIQFANEVLDELAKWDIDKINIFGYSMGGYVASYLALFTTRVQKGFTLGTKFLWTSEYAQKEVLKLNPEKILEKVPAFAEELQNRHKNTEWTEMLDKTRRMMLDLGRFNLLPLDLLYSVKSRFCIGIGDLDNTVGVDEAVAVHHAIPYSNLCILPQTQHPLEKVNPVILSEAIKLFFIEK